MSDHYIHCFHFERGRWAIFMTREPLPLRSNEAGCRIRSKIAQVVGRTVGLADLGERKISTLLPKTDPYAACLQNHSLEIERGFGSSADKVIAYGDMMYWWRMIYVPRISA